MEKFDDVHMQTAVRWSKESYCIRNKVGAVISINGRGVSSGFNGTKSGLINNCEKPCYVCNGSTIVATEEGSDICWRCDGDGLDTDDNICDHAEYNAISFARDLNIDLNGSTMYITLAPCYKCSEFIKEAGITKVIYLKAYKNNTGIDYLKSNNIKTIKYETPTMEMVNMF